MWCRTHKRVIAGLAEGRYRKRQCPVWDWGIVQVLKEREINAWKRECKPI